MIRERPHMLGVFAGLFLAAGLIISAAVLTRAWLRISEAQTIAVTGSARKNVRADLLSWRGSFSVESNSLSAAQRGLKSDLARVTSFLQAHGITNQTVSTILIQELRASVKTGEGAAHHLIVGYRLTQSIEVRSPDVERIAEVERASADLVEQGVVFSTTAMEFIYTKAGEAKVEMLAEATRDARARADQIASQGGRHLEQLRSAKMGVFQITPLHSIQTTWDGMNDTTCLEKTITAVVTASFSM